MLRVKKNLFKLILWCGKKIFSLRYRVKIIGLESIYQNAEEGVVFLPNHPALIEPLLLYPIIAPFFSPRPLVTNSFYYLKGGKFFIDATKSIPVPDFDFASNSWKIRQIEKIIITLNSKIKSGESFLLYPSGRLKVSGKEVVGGSSFVHSLLQKNKSISIVLVRTDGLWGSSFSKAITGVLPPLWTTIFDGMKKALKAGLFFMPRRNVTITFQRVSSDFPRDGSRLEINKYLENFYNRYLDGDGKYLSSEPLKQVSYSLFKQDVPKILLKTAPSFPSINPDNIPKVMKEKVFALLVDLCGKKHIDLSLKLSEDLGLDSLDIANITTFLDKSFDVQQKSPFDLQTVEDIFNVILEGKDTMASPTMLREEDILWNNERFRKNLLFPTGKTVIECFLSTADRLGSQIACYDRFSGFLSYKKIKLAIYILAKKFQKLESKYVCLMMPSSAGCYLVILAVLLARKIPVMINWTSGLRNIEHAIGSLGIKKIYTSLNFMERVSGIDLGKFNDSIVLLEDIKKTITVQDKLMAAYFSIKTKKAWIKTFNLSAMKGNDSAVILFTSGTENFPKVVPLTHNNILENQRASFSVVGINSKDIIYSCLPPFHSFGFSVTGLFPLLTGLRVMYSPDPTDTKQIIRDTERFSITTHCLAPTFYKHLFSIALPEQLSSVSTFITGSEKASSEFFNSIANLGGKKVVIEGYGITECAPIITLTRPCDQRVGVGRPIPGVDVIAIDVETSEVLDKGIDGEICISGPSVFSGYIGSSKTNCFFNKFGKIWYKSGDLGKITEDGFLVLGGRIKRFAKMGGEMVSLAAVEDALHEYADQNKLLDGSKEEPQLTLSYIEGVKPQLILFSTFELAIDKANDYLREKGFARIIKLSKNILLKEIPLTGSGKVHLHHLNKLLTNDNA